MALTLKAAIGVNDTVFDVNGADALNPGDLKTIGSENIEIRTANRATTGYLETPYYRVSAYRGALGTVKAIHAAAAALTTTVLGGGGGSFTPAGFVEPSTATPEELANSLIAASIMSGVPGGSPTPLPTADPHTDGAFWNNNGVVMVSAG